MGESVVQAGVAGNAPAGGGEAQTVEELFPFVLNDEMLQDGMRVFVYSGERYVYDPHFMNEANDFCEGWCEQGYSTANRILASILTRVARAGGEV